MKAIKKAHKQQVSIESDEIQHKRLHSGPATHGRVEIGMIDHKISEIQILYSPTEGFLPSYFMDKFQIQLGPFFVNDVKCMWIEFQSIAT